MLAVYVSSGVPGWLIAVFWLSVLLAAGGAIWFAVRGRS
jgi:hypothetical protein